MLRSEGVEGIPSRLGVESDVGDAWPSPGTSTCVSLKMVLYGSSSFRYDSAMRSMLGTFRGSLCVVVDVVVDIVVERRIIELSN